MSAKKAEAMEDRLIDFAVRVGKSWTHYPTPAWAATLPASSYAEADAAESKNDFIHKLGIVFKELRESRIWIKIIIKARMLPLKRMSALLDECEQLCNIIAQSLITAKANRRR